MRMRTKITVMFATAAMALVVGVAASAQNLEVKGQILAGTGGTSTHSFMGNASGTAKVSVGAECGGAGWGYAAIALGRDVAGEGACGTYNLLGHRESKNLYINRPTGGNMYFRENNSDQMVIAPGGNVGIGTTAPESRLHVGGDGYALFGPNSSWGARFQVGGNGRVGSYASVVTTNGNLHLDAQNGAYATYINYYSQNATSINAQGGNVGIGTTVPGHKLDVNGNMRVANYLFVGTGISAGNSNGSYTGVYGSTYVGAGVQGSSGSGYGVYCYGAFCGGNKAWTNTSDARLKTNITTVDDPLTKVLALRGVTFNWKDGSTPGRQMGFVAQEALAVAPEVVSQDKQTGMYTMQYAPLTALLVEAVKTQQEQLSAQREQTKAQLSAQQAEIQQLKALLAARP